MPAAKSGRERSKCVSVVCSKLSSSVVTAASAFCLANQNQRERDRGKGRSIFSDVGILRFVAKLGREFFIAGVDVTIVARQNRAVGPVIDRERDTEHLPEAGVETQVASA